MVTCLRLWRANMRDQECEALEVVCGEKRAPGPRHCTHFKCVVDSIVFQTTQRWKEFSGLLFTSESMTKHHDQEQYIPQCTSNVHHVHLK